MNLILDEKETKMYVEEGTIDKYYSMVDMGNHVGHQNRNWHDESQTKWYLMFYDEKTKGKQTLFHAEALVNQHGEYTRLMFDENGYRRVMQLQGEFVLSDIVYDNRNESLDGAWVGKSYIGYVHEDQTKPLPRLSAYLLGDKIFKSEDGAFFNEKPNDHRVTEYLTNNDILQTELNNTIKNSIK